MTHLNQFKEELEDTLDRYFPKIEEEGEAKKANRRSAALMLYTQAVIGAENLEKTIKLDLFEKLHTEAVKTKNLEVLDIIERLQKGLLMSEYSPAKKL